MKYIQYFLVISIIIALDQYSKFLIVSRFLIGEKITIIENFFNLTYVRNFGAGFSIFNNQTYFLQAFSLMASILLIYLLINTKPHEYLLKTSYLFMIGGAIGNLIDRIRLTYVVDFLDFLIFGYDFPVFNIADSFLTIGAFLLIIQLLREVKDEK